METGSLVKTPVTIAIAYANTSQRTALDKCLNGKVLSIFSCPLPRFVNFVIRNRLLPLEGVNIAVKHAVVT